MVINLEKLKELQKILEDFERFSKLLVEILNNIDLLKQACELGLINENYKNLIKFLEEFKESQEQHETQNVFASQDTHQEEEGDGDENA